MSALIVSQSFTQLPQDEVLAHARSLVRNQRVQKARNASVSLYQHLSHTQFRTVSLVCNKGASGWLNVLPLEDEGFSLNKEEFRDALALRYDKFISGLPSRCPCGNPFNPNHAKDCKKGGFVHARHDNLRHLEAALLSEVCKDVTVEPHLQPITGEEFDLRSANTDDEARLDVKARGLYRQRKVHFMMSE